jgi:hypothetical protein
MNEDKKRTCFGGHDGLKVEALKMLKDKGNVTLKLLMSIKCLCKKNGKRGILRNTVGDCRIGIKD